MIEAGVPGFVSVAWFAVAAPAGTPDADHRQDQQGHQRACWRSRTTKKRYAGLGAEAIGGTPEQMGKFVDAQRKLWSGIIKSNNIPQVE